MKTNIISILVSLACLNPVFAKEPSPASSQTADTQALPKKWDSDTVAVYDLLVAQLQSSDADYAASVDTLVKFANTEKDDRLFSRAFQALLQTERYDDATELAKTWKQHSTLSISKFYALALMLSGQTEQAISEIQDTFIKNKVTTEDTQSLERALSPYLRLALSHWHDSHITDVFGRLYELYPHSEDVVIMYVKQLRWQGKVEKAVSLIEELRFKSPRDINLVQEQADIYRYALQLESAETVWTQFLADYPNETTYQFAYAQFLFDRYDFTAAKEVLGQINDPELALPVNTLQMVTAIQLNQFSAAEEILANNFNDPEEKRRARFNLADNLLLQKQYDLAKPHFEQLVDWNSETEFDEQLSLFSALKVAQILYAQANDDDVSEGDKWFGRIAEHFKFSEVEALQQQSNILETSGRTQIALDRLKAFLDINPNNEGIRYSRGLIAANTQLNTLAISDLKRLYATSPDNVDVQNALGYTLLSNDEDKEKGEELIKKALFSNPSSPAIVDSMGWAYYKNGEYDKALSFLRYTYATFLDGEIVGHYILALNKAGKVDVAKRLYQLEKQYSPNLEKMQRIVAPILSELDS